MLKSEVRRLNVTLDSFRDLASLQRLHLNRVERAGGAGERRPPDPPPGDPERRPARAVRADGPLPRVSVDAEKIEQAVLNLVLNSLEAMPDGGELSLRAGVVDGQLRLLVRDTGPGIPPEIQDHIFRPYFSTKDHGTGIGLTLADKLVRQHFGRLDFRTGPDGTTFAITLPISEPPAMI